MRKAVQSLRFRSLGEVAASQIRTAIIEGEFKPGQRLIEQKLADAFGTSQQTVRVALGELEEQGFVRKIPHRGTYVTHFSADDFRKIQRVRLALEVLAIEEASRKMSEEIASQLRQLVSQMEFSASTDNRPAFHRADLEFHRIIWELAGNEYLKAALERIVFALFAFVLSGQRQSDFVAAARQHGEIVEGLCSGDPTRAGRSFLRATTRFWREHHQVQEDQGVVPALGHKAHL